MTTQPDLRLERAAERLCRLPARALYELLSQIGRDHGLTDEIRDLAEAFAQLDPEILHIVGADQFPPRPLRVVA